MSGVFRLPHLRFRTLYGMLSCMAINIERKPERDNIVSVRLSDKEIERAKRAARKLKTKPGVFNRAAIVQVSDEVLG